jgi:predicted glycoside hydrolase/deacetylase ChbG (UPF0249 family)
LEQDGVQAYCSSAQVAGGRIVLVGADVPTVLAVGGPLTNSASLTRQGGDLVMRYQLIGEGGQTYNLMNVDRSKPPQYAIYQGGEKIALGSFEFG